VLSLIRAEELAHDSLAEVMARAQAAKQHLRDLAASCDNQEATVAHADPIATLEGSKGHINKLTHAAKAKTTKKHKDLARKLVFGPRTNLRKIPAYLARETTVSK
jgi:hypothetical protein